MEMPVGRGSCAPIGIFERGEGSRFWTGDGGFENTIEWEGRDDNRGVEGSFWLIYLSTLLFRWFLGLLISDVGMID